MRRRDAAQGHDPRHGDLAERREGARRRAIDGARAPLDAHPLAPPYAPACCGDTTCYGKTIPYLPVDASPEVTLTNTRTVLGVWPKDADIALEPGVEGVASDVRVDDAPWTQPGWRTAERKLGLVNRPLQAFERTGRRYASLGLPPMDGAVFVDSGSGWKELLRRFAVPYVLATTDVDGDGRPELLVYEAWVNQYGLDVFVGDDASPAYQFSCGHI